jgi:wobble nucleotide-excising tRNase
LIQEIRLNNVATYLTPISIQPLNINFCYGSNGSGKSTLANVISGKITAENCSISWMHDPLPVLAYNKHFIEANFGERIGGIFTLGEESKDVQDFIDNKRVELEIINNSIVKMTNSKEKLEQEQQQTKTDFENTCWAIQQAHGETFAKALVGYRGSKDKFAQKCLAEYPNMDKDSPPDIKYLEELYSAAYDAQKERYNLIPLIDADSATRNETSELLGKRITGSTDTPVGKFIEYLQNSDWVKQGFAYSSRSDGKCPYCQQVIPENIQKELTDFFDESYEKDCNQLAMFARDYSANMSALLETMRSVIKLNVPILEYELFSTEVESLGKTIELNNKILSSKIASPGTIVSLESIFCCNQKIKHPRASCN